MWLLFLTLTALVLVLVACITGKWILLGAIPILFLGWVLWKFALWVAGQAPVWQNRTRIWWTTTVVPWWATNTSRVLRALMVLAIIAAAIAIVVCVTVKLGPALTSGSICSACKGTPTAVVPTTGSTASVTTLSPDSTFRVVVRKGEVTSIPLPRPYRLEHWAKENEIVVTEAYVDATNKVVRVETAPGIDSSVVMFRRFSCAQYKCGPVVLD